MVVRTDVCLVGGGPAGVMLGLLLAREGVDVVVLEKHDDFFRDFRGDTVHPSTMNLIDDLGLREAFDAIPHKPLSRLDAVVNGIRIHAIDFTTLPKPNRFLTLMPQWDLLAMLAEAGRASPSFDLRMGVEVTGVRRSEDGRVTGVHAQTAQGPVEIEAGLTVAADGRASTVRDAVGLRPREDGVPADVAWFRLPEPETPLPDTLAWITTETMLVTFPRPGYLQSGMLIPKDSFDAYRAEGIDAFRDRVARAVPRLAGSVRTLESFDDVKLLSVQINRLEQWHAPGVLFIGDAAHAMSPAFGVGINYAVQDAVAAARALLPALRSGADVVVDRASAAVQRRRERPTAMMQRIQRAVHARIATGRGLEVLQNPPTLRQRAVLSIALPLLRPVVARVVGYGFRPERLR
ncbi:FAD-dependent oxidoreductase [Microbacterium sp. SSW1-59]|uniref:FAD-dependent oxidoreductase n=1 Tax=Microbacterium xanthum TaxID=3079794 RepID=UPI002AD2BC8C|nr:FAD-dependent oxidoreductase [Microbacterium sp. SSW1-59]MDZ8200238.1 FAD-dependent oxidoreductase [Microbacterium sp. SSW1-59]